MARLAYYLSTKIKGQMIFYYFKNSLLDEPSSIPYFNELSSRITFIRLESNPNTYNLYWYLKTILAVNKNIRKDDVLISNSIFPSLIFRKHNLHIFFSTGTDITSYSNYAWIFDNVRRINYKFLLFPFAWTTRFVVILNQRRVIKGSKIIIFPGFNKDENYDAISKPLFKNASELIEFHFSDLKPIINTISNSLHEDKIDTCFTKDKINILIGCRLDDGNNYYKKFYSKFNDKGPGIILESLKKLQDPSKYNFVYFNKGTWADRFFEFQKDNERFVRIFRISQLPYSEFISFMRNADIVIDSVGDSMPGRISYDALAMNKFLIVNSSKSNLKKFFDSHVYHASIPEELLNILDDFEFDAIESHRKECSHNINLFLLSPAYNFKALLDYLAKEGLLGDT